MSNKPRRATLVLLALTLLAPACQAWKVEHRPVESVVRRGAEPIAVTMRDKRWVVLRDAELKSDSVVGQRVTGNTYGKGRTALAVRDVTQVHTRRFSFLRTIGLGVAMTFIPSLYKLAIVE